MYIDAQQIPIDKEIYIQQNLISTSNQKLNSDNIDILVNQELALKKINGNFYFPLTTELSLALNHNIQTSITCSYLIQSFKLNNSDGSTSKINNFWYCGNSFAYVPMASSIFHPKLKIFGGAGNAYGTQNNTDTSNQTVSLLFWTLKPSIALEVNLFQNFNFSLGSAYQFVFSNSSKDLQKQVSGVEANISFSLNFK
ncbi:hypothetical protein [Fluviispira multicolorata]|uniref:Outer membrane protein beta-barrel domain-containing protein n=1 Tax=Fluviispira multicolorata TaxID=2654512 RepID=A0A833JG24_9BACT|nr:hypothetical protein [Fluviispira multicolorata]KAB8031916.1 hypothetical protein GCL57_04530 [Fluviispira multicolorata]